MSSLDPGVRYWRIWVTGNRGGPFYEVCAPTAEMALDHLRRRHPKLDLTQAEVSRV